MCGIAGVWFPKSVEKTKLNPAAILALEMAGLQHRGHDSAGILTSIKEVKDFNEHKGNGLVFDVITPEIIEQIYGHSGIGHLRYSTTGKAQLSNVQPFSVFLNDGSKTERLAVAHNGNLTSELDGLRPSDSDTWKILQNFNRLNYNREIHLKIFQALKGVKGAFSLIFLYKDKFGNDSLILVRDPKGIRPLWIARFRFKGEIAYLAASETCAFDKIVGAELWRSVEPGEITIINNAGVKSYKPSTWRSHRRASCIFELIYFMHPTSIIETNYSHCHCLTYAWQVQEALGRELGMEYAKVLKGDFITPVPDSSIFHALGCSHQSRIPLEFAILRNHWVGRTFISPVKIIKSMEGYNLVQNIEKINRKFSFLRGKFANATSVIVIDDSIVRGNTFYRIINRIKFFNKSLEIKVGVASPPVKYPCFLGIATPTKKELAFNNYGGLEGIRNKLGFSELYYLSCEKLLKVAESLTGYAPDNWCTACFTGKYPVPIEREEQRRELE